MGRLGLFIVSPSHTHTTQTPFPAICLRHTRPQPSSWFDYPPTVVSYKKTSFLQFSFFFWVPNTFSGTVNIEIKDSVIGLRDSRRKKKPLSSTIDPWLYHDTWSSPGDHESTPVDIFHRYSMIHSTWPPYTLVRYTVKTDTTDIQTMNIDGSPITSRTHTYPSHSQTSSLMIFKCETFHVVVLTVVSALSSPIWGVRFE